MDSHTLLQSALLDAMDWLEDRGQKAPMPRRDPREPGRRQKELAEERLRQFFLRRFRSQLNTVKQNLDGSRKAVQIPTWLEEEFDDEESIISLSALLAELAREGVYLFNNKVGIGFELERAFAEVAKWARKHAGELIKEVDDFTRGQVGDAIARFSENLGMTIGDVVDELNPYFDDSRSMRIAVTEVTSSYAAGEKEAGNELRREFPDVRIVKQWFTNNDDRVCFVCAPLDGMIVDMDDGFTTGEGEGLDGPAAHPNCRCWVDYSTDITGERGK